MKTFRFMPCPICKTKPHIRYARMCGRKGQRKIHVYIAMVVCRCRGTTWLGFTKEQAKADSAMRWNEQVQDFLLASRVNKPEHHPLVISNIYSAATNPPGTGAHKQHAEQL